MAMRPVTNEELVKAMKIMKENNTEKTRSDMIVEMMKSRLISPAIVTTAELPEDADESLKASAPKKMVFNVLVNSKQEKYLMAFTDHEELEKWKGVTKDQHVAILRFDDLANIILDEKSDLSGYVLNPFNQNITFDREAIISLRDQKAVIDKKREQYMKENNQVKVTIMDPKEFPQELADAAITFFKKRRNINAAYLQIMKKEKEEIYLMTIDFHGNREKLFDSISDAIKPTAQRLKIKVNLCDASTSFGKEAIKNFLPFYTLEEEQK